MKTDYFALFDEPHRPWLEPEPLKEKFLALSARLHPDRVHQKGRLEREAAQQRYSELNVAYHCLRDPKERLRHLLELESGARLRDVQQIPGDLMDLFMKVALACREADGVLAEKAGVSSPLLKVQWFERGQKQMEKLQDLRQHLDGRCNRLAEELKKLNGQWDSSRVGTPIRAELLQRLEEICRLFGYFGRWMQQLQERMVQLSLPG